MPNWGGKKDGLVYCHHYGSTQLFNPTPLVRSDRGCAQGQRAESVFLKFNQAAPVQRPSTFADVCPKQSATATDTSPSSFSLQRLLHVRYSPIHPLHTTRTASAPYCWPGQETAEIFHSGPMVSVLQCLKLVAPNCVKLYTSFSPRGPGFTWSLVSGFSDPNMIRYICFHFASTCIWHHHLQPGSTPVTIHANIAHSNFHLKN